MKPTIEIKNIIDFPESPVRKIIEITTHNICAKTITVVVEQIMGKDEPYWVVDNFKTSGGCPGNLTALSKVLHGVTLDAVISDCKVVMCGVRGTSCMDQMALGLEIALSELK